MPSSIELTSYDEMILDAYDEAFNFDSSLSPLINSLSKSLKEEFFAWLRNHHSVSYKSFASFSFERQNFYFNDFYTFYC